MAPVFTLSFHVKSQFDPKYFSLAATYTPKTSANDYYHRAGQKPKILYYLGMV